MNSRQKKIHNNLLLYNFSLSIINNLFYTYIIIIYVLNIHTKVLLFRLEFGVTVAL
jgi:hypothetical protein